MTDNPYRPPTADLGAGAPSANTRFFGTPRTGVVWGLALNLVASLFTLVTLALQDGMLGAALAAPDGLDLAVAEASDTRVMAAGAFELVTYIACVVLWGMWMVRAAHNARALGSLTGWRFTPGWAFGYFFVPFLNLVRPYQAMKEIWSASEPTTELNTDGIIGLWWLFWIVSTIGANISLRLSASSEPTLDNLRFQGQIDMALGVLGIIAALAAIVMIRRINGMQSDKRRMQSETTRVVA